MPFQFTRVCCSLHLQRVFALSARTNTFFFHCTISNKYVEMTTQAKHDQQQRLEMESNGKYGQPEILSSVSLPILPPNPTESHSSSSNASSSQKYTHQLCSQSVNPCMDLVAIVSRDINTAPTPPTGNPQNAGIAGLPPPPAGMSAARSAALMRMRMAQRAKALAAAGIKEPAQETPTNSPSVTRCATLRLSLWRMSSIAGEQGARIWDVTVTVPDRFEQTQFEYEEISVDTMVWSPDGLVLGLAVNVQRRSSSDMQVKQKHQFICLYALQDGQQIRTIPFSDSVEILSMEWKALPSKNSSPYKPATGSAQHVLSLMEPLGEITTVRDDQESKARQRQRLFQAMRDPHKPKLEEDKKIKEVIASDPRGLGKTVSDFPRSLNTSSVGNTVSILIARSSSSIHIFLEGSLYLGRILASEGGNLIESRLNPQDGNVCIVREVEAGREIQFDQMETHLHKTSKSFQKVLQLQHLSTFAFELLTYGYDAIVTMRTTYQTMHADCVQVWNRRARLTAKRYATHLSSELLMLLATGFANDVMMSVLLGNDTISENNLKKMRNDLLSSLNAIETMASRLASACQRMILVFEEVLGCALWSEQFGYMFDSDKTDAIRTMLEKLKVMTRESVRLTRLLGKEHLAWTHFYRFWMYERIRQEAVRDSKAIPEAISAAGLGDLPYNAMLLVQFFERGFYNRSIEALLNISMDAKTRGDEVEDDDEEDGEESRSRATLPPKILTKNSVDILPGDNSEKDDAMFDAAKPWYRDATLQEKIEETIMTLKEEPKAEELFCTMGKKTPSPNDFAKLSEGTNLQIGPAHGLARREERAVRSLPSLKDVLVECISIASPLFYHAFANWSPHNSSSDKEKWQSLLSLEPDSTMADGRNDGLQSSAKPLQGILAPTNLSPLIRQYVSASHSDRRVAFVTETNEGHVSLTIIVTTLSAGSVPAQAEESMLIANITLGEKIKAVDLGFYSAEEIILLLQQGEDTKETVLVSLHLNELTFNSPKAKGDQHSPQSIKPHRSINLTERGGGNAQKLSLNKRKDVCATLDDEGHLTYWDLVQQGGDEHHETTEEKDEEMI